MSGSLASYLRSLKTPKYLGKIDTEKAKKGGRVFKSNCLSCHDGLNGASLNRYPIETVGTPKEIESIFLDYSTPTRQSKQLLESLQKAYPFETITHGVKARRLNGIWSKKRLMTNGTIEGLDHLFCLSGQKRLKVYRPAQTQMVHADLCQLKLEDRENLKQYFLGL